MFFFTIWLNLLPVAFKSLVQVGSTAPLFFSFIHLPFRYCFCLIQLNSQFLLDKFPYSKYMCFWPMSYLPHLSGPDTSGKSVCLSQWTKKWISELINLSLPLTPNPNMPNNVRVTIMFKVTYFEQNSGYIKIQDCQPLNKSLDSVPKSPENTHTLSVIYFYN